MKKQISGATANIKDKVGDAAESFTDKAKLK